MLRFKHFSERDDFMDQYVEKLWEVSLISSMDDYIKKGLKKPFKVHPNPKDVNKELVDQINKILKSEGLSTEQITEQAFHLVIHDENPSGQNKHIIKKEGLDINSQGVMGVCASTEIKGEEHKFYVYATAKGHIEHSFFELKVSKVTKGYKFSGKTQPEEITTKSLAASETTDLYEITASVALGIDNSSAKELSGWLTKNYILDDGNYDGDLIVEFFEYMKDLTRKVNGLVYNKWDYTMANWYLETIMGIIKGALLFRDEYTGFFANTPSEVLWNDVDKTYKYNWFRKIGKGAVNKKRTTKENTADAIIFKNGSRHWKSLYGMSDDDLANLEMKASTTDGVVEIWEEGELIAEILQVSMKHSRSGAQGGKSLTALAGWGLFNKEVRGRWEKYLWTSTANESFEMLDELFNVAKIKGYLDKGLSFVGSMLKKMVGKLKKLFWGIVNKLTSKSVMNRDLSKLYTQLNKGVLREGLNTDQVKWDKIFSDEEAPYPQWKRWKKNTIAVFEAMAKRLDTEVDRNDFFVGTNGGAAAQVKLITASFDKKDYNQVAMLNIPVNMIALRVMTSIAKRLNDQTDGFTNALQIFNSLSFDMSMGDSEVPVIKLYGVEWSVKNPSASGEVEFDVIKRIDVSSGGIADEIKGIVDPETQPMAGFSMQPSGRDSGLNYLATYMYIFYEYDGEQFTYKKMQIRPDKGGIAAESYPQTYIWDADTKTFKKK